MLSTPVVPCTVRTPFALVMVIAAGAARAGVARNTGAIDTAIPTPTMPIADRRMRDMLI
jgi:hypothetical protein